MTGPRIIHVGKEPPPMDPSSTRSPRPVARKPPRASKAKGTTSSRGRFQTINIFLDVTQAKLGRAELVVWLLLWRDTKPGGLARTSQADLARRGGCNPRTVRRALTALIEAGLVKVVAQGGLRQGLSIYRVVALRKEDSA